MDRTAFTRELDQAKADADKFASKPIQAKATVDGAQAKTTLDDLTARADKLSSKAGTIKVTADASQANTELDKTAAKADALSRKAASVKVQADATQADATLDRTSAKADALGAKNPTVKTSADTSAADAALDRTGVKADALGAKTQTVKVTADTTQANADLDRTALKADLLGRKTETVKVNSDTSTATSGIDNLSSKISDLTSGPFSLLKTAIVGLGPAAVPVLGAVTAAVLPLTAAIGSAATGLGAFGVVSKLVLTQAGTAATAVSKAQDTYNAAIASGAKQSTAYAAEQKAIAVAYAGMSTQQITLSKQVGDLDNAYKGMLKSVTPLVSSALVPWMKDIQNLLQYIKPLISPVAVLFKAWGDDLNRALTGNQANITRFMAAFAGRAADNIWNFGAALIQFAKGAGALIHDIAPNLAGASTGIAKLAFSFDGWASSQKTADAIKGFFTWAKAMAPDVKKLLEELATSVGHLIQAMAYAGGGDLKVLTIALGEIAKLPVGAIVALADAYVALSIGLRAAAAGAALWAAGETIVAAATTILDAAETIYIALMIVADAVSLPLIAVFGGIVLAIAAVGFGIYELVTHWKTAWHDILAAVDASVGALKIAWAAILVAAQDVWGWIKTNWPLLGAILLGPIAVAVLEIVKHWDTIKKAFSEALTWIKGLLGAAGTWLSNIFGDFAKPVTAEFDKIKNFVTTSFDGWWKSHGKEVEEVWNAIWTNVKNIFVSEWNAVVAAAKAGWAVLESVFRTGVSVLTAVFVPAWNAIVAVAKIGWAVITGLFRAGAAVVTVVFKNAWDVLATVVKVAWAAIQTVTRTAWAVITGLFKTGAAVVTVVFKNAFDVIAAVAKTAWAAIQAIIKIAWDIIVGIINVGLALVTGHWKQAWTDVTNTATQVWNALKQFFSTTLNAISGLFTQVLNNIKGFLSTTWNAISSTAQSVWNSIKSFLSTILNAISALVTQIFNNIKSFLQATWNSISSTAQSVWNTIKSSLSATWNSIESTAKTVFNGILSFFGGFWSALKTGFSNTVAGIKSVWDTLQTVVSAPVKFIVNTIYDKGIVPVVNAVGSLIGLKLSPLSFAEGGMVPGGYSRADNQLAFLRSGEGILQPGAVTALGGPAFIDAANRAYGDVPVGSSPPGYYLAGGTAPGRGAVLGAGNPTGSPGGVLGTIGNAASHVGSAIVHVADNIGKTLENLTGDALAAAASAILNPLVNATPGDGTALGKDLKQIPLKMVAALVNALKGTGAVSGSGADIAKYAASFLGKIPYVWGGTTLGPAGADCSGFTGSVYEHFGVHPPRTSEAQSAWAKKISSPQSGGLAFYHSSAGGADPGHVAIIQNATSVISQGGGMGPTIMSLHGMPLLSMGVPPSGFGTSGGSTPLAGGGSASANQALGKKMAAAMGWTGAEWNALNAVEMTEAGWSMTAKNPGSGAYGIAQFINGPSEYAQYGGNSSTAGGQIAGFLNYIKQRYGDPIAAENHERAYGWYDNGGWLQPGTTMAVNNTGRPEPILSPDQWENVQAMAGGDIGDKLDRIANLLAAQPRATASGVGEVLNGAARSASMRARYPRN